MLRHLWEKALNQDRGGSDIAMEEGRKGGREGGRECRLCTVVPR